MLRDVHLQHEVRRLRLLPQQVRSAPVVGRSQHHEHVRRHRCRGVPLFVVQQQVARYVHVLPGAKVLLQRADRVEQIVALKVALGHRLSVRARILNRDRSENGAHGSTTLQARRRNASRRSTNHSAGHATRATSRCPPCPPGAARAPPDAGRRTFGCSPDTSWLSGSVLGNDNGKRFVPLAACATAHCDSVIIRLALTKDTVCGLPWCHGPAPARPPARPGSRVQAARNRHMTPSLPVTRRCGCACPAPVAARRQAAGLSAWAGPSRGSPWGFSPVVLVRGRS